MKVRRPSTRRNRILERRAIPAGSYYSDVYAQFPAAVLSLLKAAVVLLPDSTRSGATPSAAVPRTNATGSGRPGRIMW